MANSLDVVERILPLISAAIKLVDGPDVVDETVPTSCEAAEGLKRIGDGLKDLEKLIVQINENLGGLVNETKDRRFKKLLRDKNGRKAVKDLRSTLDETFNCLKCLAARGESGHSQFTDLSYDNKSISFVQTALQRSPPRSNVDDAVSSLRSIQSNVKRCTEKVDGAFIHTMKLYDLSINSTCDSPLSSTVTIRDNLIQLLKPWKSTRIRSSGENGSSKRGIISVIAPHIGKAQISSSPSVPTISLLLQLPPELLILIITALNDDYLQGLPRGLDPLPNLRLTCKILAILCAPILYRYISLNEVDSKAQHRLADNAQGLGKFVHELSFHLTSGSADGEALRVYQMLAHMPNVRVITVVHEREDIARHTALLTAINQFSNFETITLQERGYRAHFNSLPRRNVEVSRTFFHQFLHNIVKLHGHRLKALRLYTLLPLTGDLYSKIRDFTPNLRHITFTGNIPVDLRSQFSEPTPWASGKTGSLQSLTLHNCGGVHAGNFARNVLSGVYGNHLKSIDLIACGHRTDVPSVPAASTPGQAMVDCLHLDHMWGFELDAMSRIPVRDFSLTRSLPEDLPRLPELLVKGFAGMKRMSLISRMASFEAWEELSKATGDAHKELQERCKNRGIQLSFDAVAWPNACVIHVHI